MRTKLFLVALAKLVTLVAMAGGVGIGVGIALSKLSDSDGAATPLVDGGAQPPAPRADAASSSTTSAGAVGSTSSTSTVTAPARTTPATVPSDPLEDVRLSVLDARLHPAGTPEGQRRRRSRLTVRIRAVNNGKRTVTLARPSLRVRSARIRTDPAADAPGTQFGPLGPGETQAVTLRFELEGDATPRLKSERRARIVVSMRTLPIRVKIGTPVKAAAGAAGAAR